MRRLYTDYEVDLNKRHRRAGYLFRNRYKSIVSCFLFNLDNNIRMKIKEVIEMLNKEGWYLARTKGSHRQLKHPSIRGVVTIAGKLSDDLAPGTLNSILKQARLK